jgi:hypothetical protein
LIIVAKIFGVADIRRALTGDFHDVDLVMFLTPQQVNNLPVSLNGESWWCSLKVSGQVA